MTLARNLVQNSFPAAINDATETVYFEKAKIEPHIISVILGSHIGTYEIKEDTQEINRYVNNQTQKCI